MTDKELRQHVQNALDWEPSLDATDIGVAVDKGVVTLRGTVGSYVEKLTAERVAVRVYGVKAVADDVVVHLERGYERTDTEIAQAAAAALQWNTTVPRQGVTVAVTNGWVTLAGTLDWPYQKEAATRAMRNLTGVKGVTNDILVILKARLEPIDVKDKIEAAFKRSAQIDARRGNVTTHDGTVTLTGHVHSWAERQEAERAAWAAPGVTQVDDRLAVVP